MSGRPARRCARSVFRKDRRAGGARIAGRISPSPLLSAGNTHSPLGFASFSPHSPTHSSLSFLCLLPFSLPLYPRPLVGPPSHFSSLPPPEPVVCVRRCRRSPPSTFLGAQHTHVGPQEGTLPQQVASRTPLIYRIGELRAWTGPLCSLRALTIWGACA